MSEVEAQEIVVKVQPETRGGRWSDGTWAPGMVQEPRIALGFQVKARDAATPIPEEEFQKLWKALGKSTADVIYRYEQVKGAIHHG